MKYLINTPFITNKEKKYVNDVLNSGWLSINGKHTQNFEKKFSKFLGVKYSLAVQSGTAALHCALKSLGVKRNDKVVIPNYTCVSNLSATTQLGAIPIIVDVEKDTFGIDKNNLENVFKKYKPKVLQLVHVYGFPAKDTLSIIKLCKKHDVKVIEDSSESLGAEINKNKIGTLGDIGVFSIRSEKMIGVGEGGVIVTKNTSLFNKIKLIASRHSPFRGSKDPYWKKYYCSGEGYNYLMPHLLGAVGLAQIEKFKNVILPKKIKIGKLYEKNFDNKNYRFSQKKIKNAKQVYWLNSIYFFKLNKSQVRKLGEHLYNNGIEVRSGFWPMNKMKNFKFIDETGINISEEIFNKILVLPSNINLKEKDIIYIRNLIDNFHLNIN